LKIILLLSLFLTLSASTLHLDYIGKFSIFGKVAEASIVYKNDGKKYQIKVMGHGTGIVGYLTDHKEYIYQSIGLVKKNQLVPLKYITQESSVDVNKTKVYRFDYEHNRTIVTKYEQKRKESHYHIFSSHKMKRKLKKSTKILDEIYDNDMITLFFNKNNHLLQMKIGASKLLRAVGSKDTQKGVIVNLITKTNGKYKYSVTLKKDYLKRGSAKITFILDRENILDEAKLNGILFFGNARVKRVLL